MSSSVLVDGIYVSNTSKLHILCWREHYLSPFLIYHLYHIIGSSLGRGDLNYIWRWSSYFTSAEYQEVTYSSSCRFLLRTLNRWFYITCTGTYHPFRSRRPKRHLALKFLVWISEVEPITYICWHGTILKSVCSLIVYHIFETVGNYVGRTTWMFGQVWKGPSRIQHLRSVDRNCISTHIYNISLPKISIVSISCYMHDVHLGWFDLPCNFSYISSKPSGSFISHYYCLIISQFNGNCL